VSVAGETEHYAENSSPDITAECSRIDQKEKDSVKSHPVKNAVLKKL